MSLLDKICQALLKILKKKDERVLLWENASPTSIFNEQEISVSTTGFRELKALAQFYTQGGVDNLLYTNVVEITIPVGYSGDIKMFSHTFGNDTESVYVWTRFVKVFANKIRFENCWLRIASNTTYSSKQNGYLIPLKIYGVKGVN